MMYERPKAIIGDSNQSFCFKKKFISLDLNLFKWNIFKKIQKHK